MTKATWTLSLATVCSALLLGVDYTPMTLVLLVLTGIVMQRNHLSHERQG